MPNPTLPASEYRSLFVSDRPLVDLRAPIEFNKGAFPCSHNLPLMTDRERELVGTCYKQQGSAAAVALGHQLVNGATKQQRVDAWLSFFAQQPHALIYCFRGGQRSQITQQWLKDAGLAATYIEGGYKALRQYLIGTIEQTPQTQSLLMLSGITGSGKTDFLKQRSEAVDLEGIANHRGSSFGRKTSPQPTQINFENQLAVALLKLQHAGSHTLLLEDESYLIGRNALPQTFFFAMQHAPVIVLETSFEQRLLRLRREYVEQMLQSFIARDGEQLGMDSLRGYLQQSINAIRKRLGHKNADELLLLIDQALEEQIQRNNTDGHLLWISELLTKYYDPMYQYQLSKKAARILFSGDQTALNQWLDQRRLIQPSCSSGV
ncbi:tRNA 2-selenouridine(34) synthase MnmH [Shewanella sp. C32]|uniref:tRNA 2-selenouridine synthase n=1 Tax=Shewanella electrica TaxID=515560 RepID=A0ABT2FMC3_9GAMM|nr:tRNA 2-selenouridine(34) synthase MnmH [Shewanella electrica]MCH1925914.1 tRNA 2-selenouridine(34) synthase MnmH [Shewanella electrica]MCS4557480.1 tRNA 2-selenouridine(34) synthase MnmH [Shewanella electrica]